MKAKITKITTEEGRKIVDTREPKGLFYIKNGPEVKRPFTGVDNTTGDAFAEDFKKLKDCKAWLRGEIER